MNGRCNDRIRFEALFNESCSIADLGRKLGYALKNNNVPGGVHKILRHKISEYGLDENKLKGQRWALGLTKSSNKIIAGIAAKNTKCWEDCFKLGSTIKNQELLRKLVQEGKRIYECEKCRISEWQGEKLVLELHHLNEIFNDNREENLQILCPNCHSHTRKGKWSIGWLK